MSIDFELLRQGGCGSGTINLKDPYTDRNTFDIGQYIEVLFDGSTPWYFGRIEEVQEESPRGVTLSLFGLWSELNEVWPGGFGANNENAPHRYARSDYWGNDPDHSLETADPVSQPEQLLCQLYKQYIQPATNVLRGVIESPSPQVGMQGVKLRGEESSAAIVRAVATSMKTASYGVDEQRQFFCKQLRSHIVRTYQEGAASTSSRGELEEFRRHTDRSLLYNRLLLTGGYLYGSGVGPGFYRYRATFRQADSINSHGERRFRAFVPWIRRNEDARQFAKEFFRRYAVPTVRYTFRTTGETTLLRPWDGRIKLLAADGTELATDHFDKVRVTFDEVPVFEITVGPEDVQFPVSDEHQRFEVAAPNDRGDGEAAPDASINSFAAFPGHSSAESINDYSC